MKGLPPFRWMVAACAMSAACASSCSDTSAKVDLESFVPAPEPRDALVVATISPESPSNPKLQLSVLAFFVDHPNGVAPDGYSRVGERASCKRATVSGCELTECTRAADPSLVFAEPVYLSAGPITFARGSGAPESVPESEPGNYRLVQPDPAPFTPGEVLSFTAGGGRVPAFTARVPYGGMPVMTSPKIGDSIVIARGRDHALAWSGVTSGTMTFAFSVSSPAGAAKESRLECTFDGAASTGTLPTALLGLMERGAELSAAPRLEAAPVMAGDWKVSVAVGQSLDLNVTNNTFKLTLDE